MTNIKKMSAEELAEKANELIGDISAKDKRYAQLTKRRILDFTTKGLLMKPFKDGNKNYYTDEHLKQLIVLKELQVKAGVSDKTMLLAITESKQAPKVENNLQQEAFNILNSFQVGGSNIDKETSSKRILKNIGNEYVASSSSELGPLSGQSAIQGSVSSNALNYTQNVNGANSNIRSLMSDSDMSFLNSPQEFYCEKNQRNEKAKVLNQLKNTNMTNEMIYEVIPGMKIVVSNFLEIQDEQKVRDFIEKFLEAYKKVDDGS